MDIEKIKKDGIVMAIETEILKRFERIHIASRVDGSIKDYSSAASEILKYTNEIHELVAHLTKEIEQ